MINSWMRLTVVAVVTLLGSGAREQQTAKDTYEVTILLSTWDRRENDLHRGPRASWHVALIDETGTAITPTTIERDRRPENVIRADYPHYGDFMQAYVAKFPKTLELMKPGAHEFRLRVWGPRGAVELTWTAAP